MSPDKLRGIGDRAAGDGQVVSLVLMANHRALTLRDRKIAFHSGEVAGLERSHRESLAGPWLSWVVGQTLHPLQLTCEVVPVRSALVEDENGAFGASLAMPIQDDPTCAVNLLDRKRTRKIVRVDTHARGRDRSRRHALSSGIQRTQNLPHIPTRVLHRCLNRFKPIALTS